jgi:hypothetical protein
LVQGIVVDVGGLQEFAMPSANNVHREFDYSFLSRKSHRRAWRAFAFIVFGSIAAASGIVMQMPGQELDTDGGSVIAAAPLNPSATPATIVSPAAPAASAPDSRQDSASPPTSAQAAPVDAMTAVATEPAATAATEPPPQSVAAAKKPEKTTAAKRSKKTARQNHPEWYDAYAWRQQNADYWRGRSSYHHHGRPVW